LSKKPPTKTDVRKADAKKARRRGKSSVPGAIKWIVALAAVAAVIYGASQMSGIAYGEDDLGVINFSALSSSEKRVALQAANRARCNCGCGLGLAQCVATDSSCPIRETNIDKIKAMIREADK
jgi:hypothetical protein